MQFTHRDFARQLTEKVTTRSATPLCALTLSLVHYIASAKDREGLVPEVVIPVGKRLGSAGDSTVRLWDLEINKLYRPKR